MATVTEDLLLAHPPACTSKVRRLCALPESVDLKVGLDAVEVLRPLAAAGAASGRTFGILVELDAGLGRTGVVAPEDAVRVAEAAASLTGARFDGLMFYPGHVRIPRTEQPGALARLSDRIEAFVAALEGAGLPPGVVSGGSTPTLWDSHLLRGVTEVRSGDVHLQRPRHRGDGSRGPRRRGLHGPGHGHQRRRTGAGRGRCGLEGALQGSPRFRRAGVRRPLRPSRRDRQGDQRGTRRPGSDRNDVAARHWRATPGSCPTTSAYRSTCRITCGASRATAPCGRCCCKGGGGWRPCRWTGHASRRSPRGSRTAGRSCWEISCWTAT